jgi:hypothetical protein
LRVLASCTDIIGSVTDLGDYIDAIISIETSSARIQTQLSARNPSFSRLTMSFRRKPKTSSGHTRMFSDLRCSVKIVTAVAVQ